MAYIDPPSWRHYLLILIDYALRHFDAADASAEGLTIASLLVSLQPPDRRPPRLGVLTGAQVWVIVEFLYALANHESGSQEQAQELLVEELWGGLG